MGEVMSPEPRQPSGEITQVDAPVNFLVEHIVEDERNQRAAADPCAQPVEEGEREAIPDN